MAFFSASLACGGPILTMVTFPPTFSLRRIASSKAWASYGLIIEGTPSRMRVFVIGSIRTSDVSGTCFRQTTKCTNIPSSIVMDDYYQLQFHHCSYFVHYSTKYVSYTHLRAHETRHDLVCRLLLEKK